MIAAYVRVSSRAQTHETQVAAIERAATARGDAVATWYAEKRSGKTIARPELDRLRADVRTGKVSRLYVFKLDRVTRSGVADTYRVVEEIKRAGCELIAVADNLHLKPGADDIASEVFVFALSLAARLERTALNDRIAAARDRMEAQGRAWGRPRRMDDTAVARARRMRAEGRTVREIAVALKVPRSTVARAVRA
jgi:DNA invertase Pin-like site-specific DNA recombinase